MTITEVKDCNAGTLNFAAFVRAIAIAAASLVLSPATPAFPQAANPALNHAFEEMMRDPSDPERSFRYAATAVEQGAINDAIAALERILLLNPQLDNIRLEVGILYHRAGNSALARRYIAAAIENPEIPPAVRERATRILTEVTQAASPHRLITRVFGGLRYDTNVNAAATGANLLLGGVLVPQDPVARRDPDASTLATINSQYTYDLGFQDFSRLELNAVGSLQRFFDRGEFNTALIGADFGPWLGLGGALGPQTEVRPYVTGTYLSFGGSDYLRQGGGGFAVRHLIGRDLELSAAVEGVHQSFDNTPRRPVAELQTGNEYRVIGGIRYNWLPSHVIGAEVGYSSKEARVPWEERTTVSGGLSYLLQYADPLGLTGQPWTTTLTAVFRAIEYDGPDPQVDPARTRSDRRTELAIVQTIGLTERTSLLVRGDYLRNDSNLANFEYDNFGVNAGVQVLF